MVRRGGPVLALLLVLAACGDADAVREGSALDADTFAVEAEAIAGGTVDLATFAGQDLVVWFWSPW